MIDKEKFMSTYYPDASTAVQQSIIKFLARADDLIGEGDPRAKLTENAAILFTGNDKNVLSQSKYLYTKERVTNLFKFFNLPAEAIPSFKEVIESVDIGSLFKDIEDVIGAIDKVGEMFYEDYVSQEDLLNIKVISILTWKGLNTSEIVNIRKKDLKIDSDKNYSLSNSSQRFPDLKLSPFEYDILNKFSLSGGCLGIPLGGHTKKRYYPFFNAEEFLFRPTLVKTERLTENGIITMFTKFSNKAHQLIGRDFRFKTLRKNGIYYRIYKDTTTHDVLKKIGIYFNTPDNFSASYFLKSEYQKWAQKFYHE